MNWFRLKACIKCCGDLALDDGDWICLQCGTYYYTGLYRPGQQPGNSVLPDDVPQTRPPEGPDERPTGNAIDCKMAETPSITDHAHGVGMAATW